VAQIQVEGGQVSIHLSFAEKVGALHGDLHFPVSAVRVSCRALRGGDGSHYSGCRFHFLQTPILGTADSEYWHCLGIRSFLLEIPQAFVITKQANGGIFQIS